MSTVYIFLFKFYFFVYLPVYGVEKLTEGSQPKIFSEYSAQDEFFSARLSQSDKNSGELKLKVDVSRAKFLKKGDQVQLSAWPVFKGLHDNHSQEGCRATVILTTPSYLFVKVDHWGTCVKQASLRRGMLLYAQCSQLKETLAKARQMTKLLLKKRSLLLGQMYHQERIAGTESLKAKQINDKYEEMIETLKRQWEDELAALGPKHIEDQKYLEHIKDDLAQIDLDLERYRIEDQSLYQDQWSL